MKHFLLLALCLLLFSCKSKQAVVPPAEYKERITERLVSYYLSSDSAYLYALLECDSMNNITLRELSELKTKRMQTELQLSGNMLTYTARTERDTAYIKVADTTSIITIPCPVMIPIEKKVNELTKLQSFQIKAAWVTEIVLLCFIVFGVMKINIFNIIKNLIKK